MANANANDTNMLRTKLPSCNIVTTLLNVVIAFCELLKFLFEFHFDIFILILLLLPINLTNLILFHFSIHTQIDYGKCGKALARHWQWLCSLWAHSSPFNIKLKRQAANSNSYFCWCTNLCNFSCIGVVVIIIARCCCQHWWVGVAVTLSIALCIMHAL